MNEGVIEEVDLSNMLLCNRFQGEEKLYNSLIINLWNFEREMSRENREN